MDHGTPAACDANEAASLVTRAVAGAAIVVAADAIGAASGKRVHRIVASRP